MRGKRILIFPSLFRQLKISLGFSLLDSVSYLNEHWRFVTNGLSLICKQAAVIHRFKRFCLPSPSQRLAPFSLCQTFHGLKYHRLPNSKGQSIQSQFYFYTEQSFPDHTHIFTDGSRNSQGVGAAFWIPSIPFSSIFSLPSSTSVFHAEQMAIFQPPSYLKLNFSSGHFLSVSDHPFGTQSL